MKFNFLQKIKQRFTKTKQQEQPRPDVGKQYVVRTGGKNRAMRRAEAKKARKGKRKRPVLPASFYTHRIDDTGERTPHTPDTMPMTSGMVNLILATRRLARKRAREAKDAAEGHLREVQDGMDRTEDGPLFRLSQDVHDAGTVRPPSWKFWMS